MKREIKDNVKYFLAVCVLVVILLMSYGCSPCERLARKCPPEIKTTERISDTTIFNVTIDHVWKNTALVKQRVYIRSNIDDTARGETGYTTAEAYVDNESIILRLQNKDSANVLVERIRELEQRLSQKTTNVKETVTVYRTRTIVWVFFGIGMVSCFYIVFSSLKRFL